MWMKRFARHTNFVLSEQTRLTAEGNPKLTDRYASFRQFESRLPLWGLAVTNNELGHPAFSHSPMSNQGV
jgi:hypothetical protein